MDKTTLGRLIFEKSMLNGNFILRSGITSNEYFDKYRFESEPEILRAVAQAFAKILPTEVDMLAGLALGGIPLATAVSLETGFPTVFVRKKSKAHGTQKTIEGIECEGKNICVVEDVVTTGGQIINRVEALRAEGATVKYAICVVNRGTRSAENLKKHDIELLSLFTLSELKELQSTVG